MPCLIRTLVNAKSVACKPGTPFQNAVVI